MNVFDKLSDHDLTPFTHDGHYFPSEDPNYIDFGYLAKDYKLGEESCTIGMIYNEYGLTPRIHICNEDGSFACCVDLLSLEYCDTEDEHSRLSNIQKQKLNEFMNSVNPVISKKSTKTRYQNAVDRWYYNHDNSYEEDFRGTQDFTKIKD